MSNVKNYTEQGGEKTVIGGTLEITSEGKFILKGSELKLVQSQTLSSASTVDDLKNEFNALLTKLKAAGIMLSE